MSAPRLIDISPTISERLGVWPGDVGFTREVSHDLDQGDHLGLSATRATVHLGAHADAPNHYLRGGEGIASRPLERYFGRCQVITVAVGRGERIQPDQLPEHLEATRVLLRTGTFPDPDNWNEDFAACSPALIDALAARGVTTVGIDTPSIDPQEDAALLSHQRVAAHDMAILEGLILDGIADGLYTLVALPLKIDGADAAPLRAALLDDGGQAAS